MVLSPELLEKAKAAATRLTDAERQALLTRADYHTAVRRLHLAGASLREIAQALSLSHQRVQQIVNGAGGSWWRRVWRTRRMPPDAVCTWCDRPPGEVEKLIAGPKVYICDACVASAEQAASSGAAAPPPPAPVARGLGRARRSSGPRQGSEGGRAPFTSSMKTSVAQRCAFCGKRAKGSRSLVTAPAGHVCTDCLRVCREILDASS